MRLRSIVVLKFGHSVLRSDPNLHDVVHEIYRWYRSGSLVLAIVSSIGDTPETLRAQARLLSQEPEPTAETELLATSASAAAALLGIAADRAGIQCRIVHPRDIGLTTRGTTLSATPVSVDESSLRSAFEHTPILILPGLVGHDRAGRIQRIEGGADLTAAFLATALGARLRLIHEVDSIYDAEVTSPTARRFANIQYQDAIRFAANAIGGDAVRYLAALSREAEVAGLAMPHSTIVSPLMSTVTERHEQRPTSVLILGLGQLGFSVYQRLTQMPKHFRIVGALVQEPLKHIGRGIAANRLFSRQEDVADLAVDVVVDLLPGVESSLELIRTFLSRDTDVVSVNAALIAKHGPSLARIAAAGSATLHYAAAVGGAAPMLETVRAFAQDDEIQSIVGMLSPTSSFVLDRCAEGVPLDTAIREARMHGFVHLEDDLSGLESERKLKILAHQAFGSSFGRITVDAVTYRTQLEARSAARLDRRMRLIARATHDGGKIEARVGLEKLASNDALCEPPSSTNVLQIFLRDGAIMKVTGRGSGRWPMTEAVIADLLECRRASYPQIIRRTAFAAAGVESRTGGSQ